MPERLQLANVPPPGLEGEQSAAGPLAYGPGELATLRNVIITGRGVVEQAPDFKLAATARDLSSVELEGVAGIFPFTTAGDAGVASAGVAFGFSLTADRIFLHQLNEDHGIIRTIAAYRLYTPTIPPHVTGFQMSGKFFFNAYGREAAASRLGMGYFDPAGVVSITSSSAANPTVITTAAAHGLSTGAFVGISGHSLAAVNDAHQVTVISSTTFSIPVDLTAGGGTGGKIYIVRPVYDLVAGGALGLLRFRGIAVHRGGTILGWGYKNEDDPDEPAFLRWCQYVTPLTWVPDVTLDTSAGGAILGTPGLAIVAAAQSGQYTVIGKESEIHALDGDYDSQFYPRQIGVAHGPVSTVGMVSIGDAAAWMSDEGPALSENGGKVSLLGTDKIRRRLLTYMDLRNTWAVHDARRERAGWLLRRNRDEDGNPLGDIYATEILWWDYAHGVFYVQPMPGMAWSAGVTKGPGIVLPGPTANVTITAASNVTQGSFRLNWTPGDTSPGVTYEVEHKKNGTTLWLPSGVASVGTNFIDVTGLLASTAYDVRVRTVRNGQATSFAQSLNYTTTLAAAAAPPAPTNVRVVSTVADDPDTPAADSKTIVTVGFDPNFDTDVTATLFVDIGASNNFANANPEGSRAASTGAITAMTRYTPGQVVDLWIRFSHPTGGNSTPTRSSDSPYTVPYAGQGHQI